MGDNGRRTIIAMVHGRELEIPVKPIAACMCGGEVFLHEDIVNGKSDIEAPDNYTRALHLLALQAVVHSTPICNEFEQMEPVNFLSWLRRKREN